MVSYFVKTMEVIPVAKAVDPDDPTKVVSKEERAKTNNAMFQATKERLMNNRRSERARSLSKELKGRVDVISSLRGGTSLPSASTPILTL